MDEENIETQETEEVDDGIFDDGWDDDSPGTEVQSEEAPEAEEAADEPEPEGEEPEPTEEPEPEEQPEEGHQLFTLKHLGEDKQVSLEELTTLAQKGMDYDHVRQERDELKGKAGKNIDDLEEKAGYLQEIADLAGSTVEELVIRTRARKLMREDPDLTETDAILRARTGRQPVEQPADADAQQNLKVFLETYPDVKAEDIPQEVWKDSFAHGGDLTGAYARWENKQLKAQLNQLKQDQQNKTRSTGSRRTAGAASKKSSFDDGWDSDV